MSRPRLRPWVLLQVAVVVGTVCGHNLVMAQSASDDKEDDIEDEATPKRSQKNVEKYEWRVREGETFFEDGEWAMARASFKKAYKLYPRPLLLFNIASTYRREGKRRQALRYYKEYLKVAPSDADYRGVAQEAVVNLQEQEQADKERSTSGAQAIKGGKSGGYVQRYVGMGIGALGIGLLGFGVYRGSQASDLDTFFNNLEEGREWTPELQADFDRGKSLETQSIVFSVVGGVAVIGGGVLILMSVLSDSGEDEQPLVLAPLAGPNTAGFALSGHF